VKKIGAMIGLTALMFTCTASLAEGPPGLMKQGKIPPGFSHGKKVGWQNGYPPGWDNKSEIEKGQWKQAVKKGRDGVSNGAKEKGWSAKEAESAADDFERAARIGLDPEEAERLVKDKMTRGMKGVELSVSVAEETEMLLQEKVQESKKSTDTGKSKNKGKRIKYTP
jgi:hypothetical protein